MKKIKEAVLVIFVLAVIIVNIYILKYQINRVDELISKSLIVSIGNILRLIVTILAFNIVLVYIHRSIQTIVGMIYNILMGVKDSGRN